MESIANNVTALLNICQIMANDKKNMFYDKVEGRIFLDSELSSIYD